jgi:hypothetical protein
MSSKGGVPPPGDGTGVAPPNGATTFDNPVGASPGVAPPNGATTFDRPTGASPHTKTGGRQPSELTGEAATERSRGE